MFVAMTGKQADTQLLLQLADPGNSPQTGSGRDSQQPGPKCRVLLTSIKVRKQFRYPLIHGLVTAATAATTHIKAATTAALFAGAAKHGAETMNTLGTDPP